MGDDVARPYRVTGLHLDLFHSSAPFGIHVVLHLHRLEDADRLADFDRVAHVNQHLDDGALHGHGHGAGAGPGRCRFRTLGAGIRPGGGTAATGPTTGADTSALTPLRSNDCSTQLVECLALAKSGWERIATSAGRVVATPSMTVSSMALSIRFRADSRSWPHTTNLAMRLS